MPEVVRDFSSMWPSHLRGFAVPVLLLIFAYCIVTLVVMIRGKVLLYSSLMFFGSVKLSMLEGGSGERKLPSFVGEGYKVIRRIFYFGAGRKLRRAAKKMEMLRNSGFADNPLPKSNVS
jgi:hypothetical protein